MSQSTALSHSMSQYDTPSGEDPFAIAPSCDPAERAEPQDTQSRHSSGCNRNTAPQRIVPRRMAHGNSGRREVFGVPLELDGALTLSGTRFGLPAELQVAENRRCSFSANAGLEVKGCDVVWLGVCGC